MLMSTSSSCGQQYKRSDNAIGRASLKSWHRMASDLARLSEREVLLVKHLLC